MSLFPLRRVSRHSEITGPVLPERPGSAGRGLEMVTDDSAMRHSAVWACKRLRGDLISTMPVDVFRRVLGINVEVPKPPILISPGGEEWDYLDWMYASQGDLDGVGNSIGLITERNSLGLPARIELQTPARCSVIKRKDGRTQYRIDGKVYERYKVWHERQFVVSGLPVGLSPIAYAAMSISEGLTLQRFALDWYGGGAVPKARMHNTEKTINQRDAALTKERYHAAVSTGDLFVHGKDWEFDFLQAESIGVEWLDARRFTVPDIARFFGCPADLIEAAISAPGSITYASITQRNLQFLIMHLGPAIVRRERTLSALLPRPRFVKLNTDALLRMDPETRERVIASRVAQRRLTNSEARALDNLPPLTSDQEDEFNRLYGSPKGATPSAAERDRAAWYEQVSPFSAVPMGSWIDDGSVRLPR